MDPENLAAKIFLFVAKAKLKSLKIFLVGHDIDELHLMNILACESNWPADRVYQSECFHDAESAAMYEMKTTKPGWEWRGIPKSLGLALWNHALWKQTREQSYEALIIRTGESEFRVYRVKSA